VQISREFIIFWILSTKYLTSTISNEERNLSLVFIFTDLTTRSLTFVRNDGLGYHDARDNSLTSFFHYHLHSPLWADCNKGFGYDVLAWHKVHFPF